MAAFSQPIPLPTSVETVEVLAARSAVCLARDLNLGQVIFEGDAEVIIKAINFGGFSSSSFGHIIRDIKLLSSAFNKVSFILQTLSFSYASFAARPCLLLLSFQCKQFVYMKIT